MTPPITQTVSPYAYFTFQSSLPRDKPVYLSGPMTGLVDFNLPRFAEVAERLRRAGYEVINPGEVKLPEGTPKTWDNFMRADIPLVCRAGSICCLEGWEDSSGAQIEVLIGARLGLPLSHILFLELP